MTTTTRRKIYLTLSASDTTIMHRAGMVGLWMTLQQLERQFPTPESRPGNLSWLLTNNSISLDWQGEDFTVLDGLLRQSFQINEKGLISLIGLDSSSINLINQIHIHQAIGATFLRHNRFYTSGQQTSEDVEVNGIEGKFTYKYQKIEEYVHQTFANHLCDEAGQLIRDYIQIVSWIYPGAIVRHARLDKYNKLEETFEYALALLFLPVVCQLLLYKKLKKDSKQRSLIDIQDIEIGAKAILSDKLINKYFQKNKVFWDGFNLNVKVNFIKGMIADNLVKGIPWWSDFWITFNQDTLGDLSKQMFYNREGLRSMIETDKEMEVYKSFIRACHEALRKTYGKIYGRTKEGNVPRIDREYERIRGELGRCYDQQSFNDFLSDFLSRAGLNSALYNQWESILPLLTGQVSWEKARNLVLIALASYKPSEKPSEEFSQNSEVTSETPS